MTHQIHAFGTAVILLGLSPLAVLAQPAMNIAPNVQKGELEIRYKGRKLLVYAFATNQFKPYVRELYTLEGQNVLRDAPPDHLHHHGLMYAVWVNGVNFWEEREAPGIEKSVELLSYRASNSPAGFPQAQFTQLVHWLKPADRAAANSSSAALLLETRTLTLTVDEASREVALRWEAEFEAGKEPMKVQGANYTGLGLRLPESFNHVAAFQNSANAPYRGNNTQDVIEAEWSSASGIIAGKPGLVALFGYPANARGTGSFFTMLDPFAYLSVTQGVDKAPLEYDSGAKFALHYLLTLYPEVKSREFLQARDARWQKEGR